MINSNPHAPHRGELPERPSSSAILEDDGESEPMTEAPDGHAAILFRTLEAAIRAGFSIQIEPTRYGTFVCRARAALTNPRAPSTSRVEPMAVERKDARDAVAQVATVLALELGRDAEERAARWEAMDREDEEALLDGTAPVTHHERDNRTEAAE